MKNRGQNRSEKGASRAGGVRKCFLTPPVTSSPIFDVSKGRCNVGCKEIVTVTGWLLRPHTLKIKAIPDVHGLIGALCMRIC